MSVSVLIACKIGRLKNKYTTNRDESALGKLLEETRFIIIILSFINDLLCASMIPS